MSIARSRHGPLLLRRQFNTKPRSQARTFLPKSVSVAYAKKLHVLWIEVFDEARSLGIDVRLLKHDARELREWAPVLRLFNAELRKIRRKYRAMAAMKAPLGQIYAFDQREE